MKRTRNESDGDEDPREREENTPEHRIYFKINDFVMPGDCVGKIFPNLKIRLGPGLMQEKESIIATKAGVFKHKSPCTYWLESNQVRYVPALEDVVIGIIAEKHAENYKVDIGAAANAILSTLAFDGVTKKNKPNLVVGALIYARVIVANKDMEAELSCVSIGNKTGFGELKSGFMFKCSLNLCRQLNAKQCLVLQLIGEKIPYEIAIGSNGRVWINSPSMSHTIIISNALINSEYLSAKQTQVLISKMFETGT
eukprot:TRINITY_DN16534_c0_g1_i1.p1 TRINITY_DN16534_c0_g1~~TRINITY_DN16534_c0_g1_i1.p1  ORF type:complete len:264 (-),score=63.96 TRINITY_DN16534_c0_g1_i1:27-788(-)